MLAVSIALRADFLAFVVLIQSSLLLMTSSPDDVTALCEPEMSISA